MKYAVVRMGGNQYKVKEGDELEVDRLSQKEEEEVDVPEVLLVVKDEKVEIGQPKLEKVSVKAKILSHFKGEKIRVARFHAKARYRKVKGFRPFLTKIRIEKITIAETQKKAKTQKTPK